MAIYAAAKSKKKVWFIILFICFLVLNDFGLVGLHIF
jgi:hypothetical protein